MVFIITTAEPLSAFFMTISGLSLRALRPILSCFVRLLCLECVGLHLRISCLTDLWNMSNVCSVGLVSMWISV